MGGAKVRTRSISAKLTEDEWRELLPQIGDEKPATWVRKVLLEQRERARTDVVVVGELMAVRKALLSFMGSVASGRPLTYEGAKQIVDDADVGKTTKAKVLLGIG